MSLLEGHFRVCHHLWESRTRQHLPTLPPRLLWPFFNSVPWFSDGFFGGRRWSRKDIFLRSCFWGEWNKHTWSHMKGMQVKFRRNKKYMDMWVETEKPWKFSPPKKKVSHHSDEPRLVESPRFVESVRFFVVLESVNTTHHLICATWKLC